MLRNLITALKHPGIAGAYSRWLLQRHIMRRAPTKIIRNQIAVSGFSGFSEFLAVDNFLSGPEYSFLAHHDFDHGDIIDIGANIGVISVLLAKRFPARTIHAIEPNPHTAASLALNLKTNNTANVVVHAVAIADTTGRVLFNANPVSRGTASIAKRHGKEVHEVPCLTLDDFVEKHSLAKVAFLKVDVEGYESLVFEGGKHTLGRHIPQIIYFEICPSITRAAGFEPSAPAKALLDFGYSLYKLNERGRPVPADLAEINTINYTNWLAI